MGCRISRWMVSRAEDTGKGLPRFVERHVARCAACGEFARSAASVASRLRTERQAWLAKVPDFPVEPGAAPSPATSSRLRARPFLRPLPVAAASLLVGAGLVLFQVFRQEPGPSAQDRLAARAAIGRLTSAPQRLPTAIGEAESALGRERRILERSVSSAVTYLQARLNIRIERKEPPKPL